MVGHSNTVPAIVRKLSGMSVPEIPEDEYDNVYVVTVPSFGRSECSAAEVLSCARDGRYSGPSPCE